MLKINYFFANEHAWTLLLCLKMLKWYRICEFYLKYIWKCLIQPLIVTGFTFNENFIIWWMPVEKNVWTCPKWRVAKCLELKTKYYIEILFKKEKKKKERKYYIEISHCFMWYTVKWLHARISNVMQNNNIILSEILSNFLRNKIIYIIDTWNQSK